MKDKFSESSWFEDLPDSEENVSTINLELFFSTMKERQDMFFKRFNKKPMPWTDDEILSENKFTNIYRELDRQSQWLITNILLKLDEDGECLKDLFYYIILFKYYNNNEFFDLWKGLGTTMNGLPKRENYNPDFFYTRMLETRKKGVNPFTIAYPTNTVVCTGKSRDYCFAYKVIPELISNIDNIFEIYQTKSLKHFIKSLESLPSVSTFLAHEFFQDFTYITKYCSNNTFKYDQNDYTNVGPGCEVGIRLIFPNLQTKNEKVQAIHDLRDLSPTLLSELGDFKYLHFNKVNKEYYFSEEWNLTLHNIEFWLCEYSKYWKMLIGKGKQRSKYKQNKDKDYSFYLY